MRRLTFLIATGLAIASPARCATLQIFHPAPGRDALIVTHTASVPAHLAWSAGLVTDFSDDVLLLRNGSRVIDSRLGVHAMGTLALWDLLDVGIVVPGAAAQFGRTEGASLGDVRLVPKIGLYGWERGRLALRAAFVAEVTFPSGDEGMGNGDPGLTGVPRLAFEVRFGRWAGVLNAGYRLRESSSVSGVGGVEVDDEVVLSLGGRAEIGMGFEAIVDAYAFIGTAVNAGIDETAVPSEALAAVRYTRLPGGLSVQLGGGMGLTAGYGAADSRILASVSFEPTPGPNRPREAADRRPPSPRVEEREEDVEWEWDLE